MNRRGLIGKALDSISSKVAVIIILSILPLNVLVVIATYQSISAVQNQAHASLESTGGLHMQGLDSRISAVNYYFYDLEENDADFLRLMRQEGDDAYRISQTAVARKFNTAVMASDTADGFFYCAAGLADLVLILPGSLTGQPGVAATRMRREISGWLAATEIIRFTGWNVVEVEGAEWLLRVYGNEHFYYGALISLDELALQISETIEYDGLEINILPRGSSAPAQKGSIGADIDSTRADLTLSLAVPRRSVIMSLPLTQWASIVFAFMYLFLIPLLLILLNRILIRPLRGIRGALLHLKQGDRQYRMDSSRDSLEFREINQSFNEMADNIEHLKIENYEKEMARQRMELRNLQLQIRPHFLLNMFKLMFSLAQMKEFASIQKLTLYLSNYFRYIFRSGRDLEPFAREYDLIKEYLEISVLRYPSGFEARYEVDDDALAVNIPPLLIHNFIENVINHGLVSGRTVQIALKAECRDGWAVFEISDDGAGISEQITDNINNGVFRTEEGGRIHVGIYNSLQRIRYFYGEESTLQVRSEPGKGSCFVVRFPYDPKED